MSRPPSNEFFMKQAWNVSDTKDLYHANGDNFDSFVRDMYRLGYLKSDKYKTYDDFARDFMDPDSSANTDGFWHGWSGASTEQAGRRNYILEQARKYYENNSASSKPKPEQVNATPGSFTTSTGATVSTSPVTQGTTGGTQAPAPSQQAPVNPNDMTDQQYVTYLNNNQGTIDAYKQQYGMSDQEARDFVYRNDKRYQEAAKYRMPAYSGSYAQQPQQSVAQQPQQPQQPQQAVAQQPQKPIPAIKKAASLAKSFAAGRFSSDEAGDNKAAANRAALWNKFNGD